MTRSKEHTPAAVPLAMQAGAASVRDDWTWTKPWVWTDRMLTALVNGVKGGQWPNAYFGKRKLFSLKTAHELACQSSTR